MQALLTGVSAQRLLAHLLSPSTTILSALTYETDKRPAVLLTGYYPQGQVTVAFDNRGGECFVEEFATPEQAAAWCRGEIEHDAIGTVVAPAPLTPEQVLSLSLEALHERLQAFGQLDRVPTRLQPLTWDRARLAAAEYEVDGFVYDKRADTDVLQADVFAALNRAGQGPVLDAYRQALTAVMAAHEAVA